MIVYLTNRDVHEKNIDKKPLKVFGNTFNKEGDDKLRMCVSEPFKDGKKTKWTYDLVKKGQEKRRIGSIRTRIQNDHLSADWLLFLHGNNQSFKKNIKKCEKLAEQYKVNVIAFSWPSQPKVDKEALVRAARKLSLQAKIVEAIALSTSKIIGLVLYRKISQYLTSEINAGRSTVAFNDVLGLVQDELQGKLPTDNKLNLNFLSYSLGNRVLKFTQIADNLGNGNKLFTNHIMCQADVNLANHSEWMDDMSYGERLYVTHNEFDLILGMSDIQNLDRLGNTTNDLNLPLPCHYVDFTEGKNVNSTHSMFFIKQDENPSVRNFFNNVLLGKNFFRNRKPPKTSGFKYNKKPNTYSLLKTEAYMEPEDDSDD